jgi:hypothetical protein
MGAQEIILLNEQVNVESPVTQFDLITSLCAQRNAELKQIEYVSNVIQSDAYRSSLTHYNTAAAQQSRKGASFSGTIDVRLFDVEPARKALDAVFWGKVLALTDVLESMPAKRRNEWKDLIHAGDCPEFVDDNVRATLQSLMADRDRFFAERVDGVFQALSREHVTNIPSGYRHRMILGYIFGDHGISSRNAADICDLRAVVARIMKRGEPDARLTEAALADAYHRAPGEWQELDGGAIRFKCYRVGTVHIQVDSEMACELNSVLASIYPNAIPAEFRERATRRRKTARVFYLEQKRLPFGVLNLLSYMDPKNHGGDEWTCEISNSLGADKVTVNEARRVVESIGGVKKWDNWDYFGFDYDPKPILREVMASGCIPESKSHQFYATHEKLGTIAAAHLGAKDGDDCLEPNGGQGGLAKFLPKASTIVVEISALHCKILTQKGYNTTNADFLEWAKTTSYNADKVLMNPPFSQGRAQLHVEAAAKLVKSKGRLVSILPLSMRDKDFLVGFDHEWSLPYANEFDGTGISTVMLVANRRT